MISHVIHADIDSGMRITKQDANAVHIKKALPEAELCTRSGNYTLILQ